MERRVSNRLKRVYKIFPRKTGDTVNPSWGKNRLIHQLNNTSSFPYYIASTPSCLLLVIILNNGTLDLPWDTLISQAIDPTTTVTLIHFLFFNFNCSHTAFCLLFPVFIEHILFA